MKSWRDLSKETKAQITEASDQSLGDDRNYVPWYKTLYVLVKLTKVSSKMSLN